MHTKQPDPGKSIALYKQEKTPESMWLFGGFMHFAAFVQLAQGGGENSFIE